MEANSTDIHTKYQKVASEYSKTRAQVSVLKKAILDEQSKVGELKDVIKERDLSIRKYEQEIDSLTFRNQQLAKRVTVLQDEFDALTLNKSKKNKNKSDAASADGFSKNLIFNEELESKIEENARLHQLLSETEQKQQNIIEELTLRLESADQEGKHHQNALQTIHDQHKIIIDKLQQDKIQLEIRHQTQEKELKELRMKIEESEKEVENIEKDLGNKLCEATRILDEQVQFNDTKFDELNALNIPTYDRKHQLEIRELIAQIGLVIRDLVTGLSNFHTYTEQRVLLCAQEGDNQRPLKHIHQKLAKYLHENATYLRPIEHSFMAFQRSLEEDHFLKLETATGLQEFADKFHKYCAYLNKLLPYYHLSLEDECSSSSCTPSLEAKNMQFYSSLTRITMTFSKMNTYLLALAAQSDQTQSHPSVSQEQLLIMLVHCLHELENVIKEASIHYNGRVSLEHQLPTSTAKMRSTDECVLSSMIALVTCTSKLSTLMKTKFSLIVKDIGQSNKKGLTFSRKMSPAVGRFKQRAANYITKLQQTEAPKSVPYHEALCNQEILLSSTESRESLARQLATSQEKLSKLEQAKEHWMLEFQLLQIKHEKDVKKLQKLEEQLRAGSDAISNVSSGSSIDDVLIPNGSPSTVCMLGKMDAVNTTMTQGDNRESEIKSYFTQHIKELVTQMQMADSKAVAYHAELISLQRRLQLAETNRSQLVDQLTTSHLVSDQLKEELSLTTKSYEGQLNMMSEHLANMNDKLTNQKDEIDSLKLRMSNMGSKKQKGK